MADTLQHHWPWTGHRFDDFISNKKADYMGLLAQATGELLEAGDACHHRQQELGMFDGCVRVPGLKNCANCHIGGRHLRCSLESGIRSSKTSVGATVPASTNLTILEQNYERAKLEQADLLRILEQNQSVVDHTQIVLEQALEILATTHRLLDQKTKEVNALDDGVKNELNEQDNPT
ncbi:hypothetical protein N7466_003218 [Penicillium verhagenii]|uniref:uncharacterized protein n=1 Tax=Penicillium verhagenii TaxID=1562060 RepID=UPI0025458649|nr:uncharacterized protein N7466_003218 [Penicillium verhagenii]KAJ5936768.1 hypothetical protein N7466_003218 [Penicillium verhagenii]